MMILPSVPSPPLYLMAVDVGSSSVSLTWFPPMKPNGILLFYQVMASKVGGSTAEIVGDISANVSTFDMVKIPAKESDLEDLSTTNVSIAFTLTRLSPHTEYVITVAANTSAGYGNRSEELHIKSDLGVCACLWMCTCACGHACVIQLPVP